MVNESPISICNSVPNSTAISESSPISISGRSFSGSPSVESISSSSPETVLRSCSRRAGPFNFLSFATNSLSLRPDRFRDGASPSRRLGDSPPSPICIRRQSTSMTVVCVRSPVIIFSNTSCASSLASGVIPWSAMLLRMRGSSAIPAAQGPQLTAKPGNPIWRRCHASPSR